MANPIPIMCQGFQTTLNNLAADLKLLQDELNGNSRNRRSKDVIRADIASNTRETQSTIVQLEACVRANALPSPPPTTQPVISTDQTLVPSRPTPKVISLGFLQTK